MTKKTRNIKLFLGIALTFFLFSNTLLFPVMSVYAQPRTGNIEIDFEGRTDDRENILLSGAKFEIFPVQYMDNDVMVWRDEFAKCGNSLDDSSSEARAEQAKALFEYAKANNMTGIIHETDEKGHAHFLNLAEGMYLLVEIGNVDSGLDEFDSAPFLVKIPSEVGGEFEYDVDVEPKARWVSHDGEPVGPDEPTDPSKDNPEEPPYPPKENPEEPEKPNTIQKIINTVKTGDTTNIVAWFLIAIVSLGLIVGLYKKRKME